MSKRTRHRNIVADIMGEYVAWGGPVITRAEARADMVSRGFTAREIDICVFGRRSVPAPADPAAHLAFHRQIMEMEAARA